MPTGSFEDFLDALRAFESGVDYERYLEGIITEWQIRDWVGDDTWESYLAGAVSWTEMQYRSMNSLGFVGYQFGEALLIDLGYYKDDQYYGNGAASNTWDGEWTGKNGAISLEAFMSAEVQEAAIRDAFGFNLEVIENGLAAQGMSLDDLIGRTTRYTAASGAVVQVELSLSGILAAAHLRGAWGTLDLLLNGAVSHDENGTSILAYIDQFGGYDAPDTASLITDWVAGRTGHEPSVGGSPETTLDIVATLTWSWGSHETVPDFDPETETIDLGQVFGASDLVLRDSPEGVVIGVQFGDEGEQQTLTLTGIALEDLSMENFAREGTAADSLAAFLDGELLSEESPPPVDDGGEPSPAPTPVAIEDGQRGETITLTWSWGAEIVTNFDPATDRVDLVWFQASAFTISEQGNAVVIGIPSNNQTYVLNGVSLADLGADNFIGRDADALNAVYAALEGNDGVSPETPSIEEPVATDPAETGSVLTLAWDWGSSQIVQFEPETDIVDLRWFQANQLEITEETDGINIAIADNNQDYLLQDVRFEDLGMDNFTGNDVTALEEVAVTLGFGSDWIL